MREGDVINLQNAKLIFGLRRANKSLKVYELPDKKYVGIEKKYFLNFCYSKKETEYKNYSEAEDHIVYFKSDTVV